MSNGDEIVRKRDSSGRYLTYSFSESLKARKRNRERDRRWREDHPKRMNLYRRRWKKAHPSKDARSKREYKKRNREIVLSAERRRRWKIRLKVISSLGGRCSRCGTDDPRVLQVNHVHGGGQQELRKLHLTNQQFHLRIANGSHTTDGLNLLCANCNVLYEYERGTYANFHPNVHKAIVRQES